MIFQAVAVKKMFEFVLLLRFFVSNVLDQSHLEHSGADSEFIRFLKKVDRAKFGYLKVQSTGWMPYNYQQVFVVVAHITFHTHTI